MRGNMTDESGAIMLGAQITLTEPYRGGSISNEVETLKVADTPLIDSYPSPLAMFATLPGVQGNGWDLKISGQDALQQSIQTAGDFLWITKIWGGWGL